MGYPVTKNRMEPGGDRWIIGGTIDREGAPILNELSVVLAQHYQIIPDASSATAILAATALTDAVQEISENISNPDVPRIVTVKGNAVGISGNVVISGTNILDEVITETIALNGSTEVLGTKAFKTISEIQLPIETNAGTDTVSVGVGKKFGIPHIVYNAAMVLVKLFNGSADTGTLAVDVDEIEKNLFALNGTPDGVKVLDLCYLV